ncbi:hypothetical protein ACTMSW_29645 [Micromonospora sp. BQ11]|uniref:hypothetical protein n=1 Tax=Micromonospora sp. BQ11 TaxID=3452212 RepID=UPI003F898AC2
MIFRRAGRPADRDASDRLLDAVRSAPGSRGTDPLADLLAAASASARPTELAGEEAAMAAFRAARAATPTPVPHRPQRRRRFTAGAVAWGAGIAVTATAGAAFAAVTLDRADDPAPPRRPATPAPADTSSGGSTSGGSTSGGSTGGPGTPTGGGSTGAGPSTLAPSVVPSATPDASVTPGGGGRTTEPPTGQVAGLCRAYLAKSPAQRTKALKTPAFAKLVTAAGGVEEVEDFCRGLVGEKKPGNSKKAPASPEPTAAGGPSTSPSPTPGS